MYSTTGFSDKLCLHSNGDNELNLFGHTVIDLANQELSDSLGLIKVSVATIGKTPDILFSWDKLIKDCLNDVVLPAPYGKHNTCTPLVGYNILNFRSAVSLGLST